MEVTEVTRRKVFRTTPRACTPHKPVSGVDDEGQQLALERLLTSWPNPTRWERGWAAILAGARAVERVPTDVRKAWRSGCRPLNPSGRLTVWLDGVRQRLTARLPS